MTLLCVVVAQKPWGKRRIDDIVRTGAGALNVDKARIMTEHTKPRYSNGKNIYGGNALNESITVQTTSRDGCPSGRWPSNFCLIHSPGCERAGVKRVKGSPGWNKLGQLDAWRKLEGRDDRPAKPKERADPDGLETVTDWRCVEGCVCRKLGEQTSHLHGAGHTRDGTQANVAMSYDASAYMMPQNRKMHRFGDKGTAARFYFQADWEYEKMERTMTGGDMGKHEVICDDVLHWAEEYEGEKFHAILCDPQYALSKKKPLDMDAPIEDEIKTVADLLEAYHSLQQWGDTGFMNKPWDDSLAFDPKTWRLLAQHLHPGGFVMAFASSRGWHRLACAMEDANLIIQPSLFIWLNAQSFPKASRLRKAPKPERQKLYRWLGWLGRLGNWWLRRKGGQPKYYLDFVWEGHRYGGQVLKDCASPIICAQKPWTNPRLDCIVETGAGAINVDEARIKVEGMRPARQSENHELSRSVYVGGAATQGGSKAIGQTSQGRWPANFALVHSPGCRRVGVRRVRGSYIEKPCNYEGDAGMFGNDGDRPARGIGSPDGMETVDDWECEEGCVVARLGEQSGIRHTHATGPKPQMGSIGYGSDRGKIDFEPYGDDKGTAARFYVQADWSHEIAERLAASEPVHYEPKAAKRERNNGLNDFYWRKDKSSPIGFIRITKEEWETLGEEEERIKAETGKRVSLRARGNTHPTVKPISLCEWLGKLLLPPAEYAPRRILIPFSGTGSEAIGAGLAGWDEITCVELYQDHCDMAKARLAFWLDGARQMELL